jgi:2-succinyl-6-hydroxy-2,4-cyclohexadiene-1-carboxylate synthase
MVEPPVSRLVFLHGFTQTHHHWHECAACLADAVGGNPTLCFVDLPGHGLSGADRLSIEEAAPRLVELAGSGTYVGYSMGARHALAAACLASSAIARLVLIGGTAGIDDPDGRRRRDADDHRLAERIEAIGVAAFVDEWLTKPMFAGIDWATEDRRQRARNTAAGLAASLRLAGTGAQRSYWDELAAIDIPVLVLAGERDAKFTEIGHRLAESIPHATFRAIPSAGHAAHTEQPAATADLIAQWLHPSLDSAASGLLDQR